MLNASNQNRREKTKPEKRFATTERERAQNLGTAVNLEQPSRNPILLYEPVWSIIE
jgi:hypothetical protein